jgi:hypothetical protein
MVIQYVLWELFHRGLLFSEADQALAAALGEYYKKYEVEDEDRDVHNAWLTAQAQHGRLTVQREGKSA